ncbi:MAG: hypothetical protein BWY14_00685 [Parcubacteria group bacterium ADurb.Bin192]|nr:MAG: hypothetical protein BWY14_00685 [Parcubacteria group bacterium ADurb.Bin192]
MFRLPSLVLPASPMHPWLWVVYILFGLSLVIFIFFWFWAFWHAVRTPRANWGQRLIWGILLLNPTATVWYWCIWKRWAFWSLFTPLLGIFIALPLVIRSLMTKADATSFTNTLFALGSNRLVILFVILMIYPIVLKLAIVLHLTKNTDVTAMDRNDWVLTMAMPVMGYGSALSYSSKFMKSWALSSLLWLIIALFAAQAMVMNIAPVIIPAGDEKREEFLLHK